MTRRRRAAPIVIELGIGSMELAGNVDGQHLGEVFHRYLVHSSGVPFRRYGQGEDAVHTRWVRT